MVYGILNQEKKMNENNNTLPESKEEKNLIIPKSTLVSAVVAGIFIVLSAVLLVILIIGSNSKDKNSEEKADDVITVDNGYLVVNGVKTEHKVHKEPVISVIDGYLAVNGVKTEYKADKADIITVEDGYLVVNGVKTEYTVSESKEHFFSEWTHYGSDNIDCENKLYYRTCEKCLTAEWREGSYSDHKFVTVTTEPTCQSGGYDTKKCIVCNKSEILNETEKLSHQHGDDYLSDLTHHWKECLSCGTKEFKDEHTVNDNKCTVCHRVIHETNAGGFCTICGEIVAAPNLPALIDSLVANSDKVNGGLLEYGFVGNSNLGAMYSSSITDKVEYIFGKNNYTYVNVLSSINNEGVTADSTFTSWHQLDEDDQAFGVCSENGGPLSSACDSALRLNGYYIALSSIVGEYGAEATLNALYRLAPKNYNSYSFDPDTNVLSFSYTLLQVNEINITDAGRNKSTIYNVNYYEIEISFGFTKDLVLTSLDVKVDRYTNDPGTENYYSGGLRYDDIDIEYNPDNGEITFIEYVMDDSGERIAIPTDKRTPDTYTLHLTQTVGARDENNPNPKEKFTPSSFDLYLSKTHHYDSEKDQLSDKYDGGKLQIYVGNAINLYVDNCYPSGTNLLFARDKVSYKLYKDGYEIENPSNLSNEDAVAVFTVSGEFSTFFVVPKEAGDYRLEIYVENSKIYDIEIDAVDMDPVTPELRDNEFAIFASELHSWSDNEVVFTANEAGVYHFNLPEGIGVIDADRVDEAYESSDMERFPKPYYDCATSHGARSFMLRLSEGESVRFYIHALEKGFHIITYLVEPVA